MSSYRYMTATDETAETFTSKKAAIAAARAFAKQGHVAYVTKFIADDAGVIRTNLGRIHSSFPKAARA